MIALLAITMLGQSALAKPREKNISIDIRNADIYDVVQLLAIQSGTNIVLHSSVKHQRITFRVLDRPFSDVLEALCEQNDLLAVDSGDSILLGSTTIMNRRGAANSSRLGVFTQVFALHYARADQTFIESMKASLPLNTVVAGQPRTNSVLVTGSDATIERARRVVAEFDQPLHANPATAPTSVALSYISAKLAVDTIKSAVTTQPGDSAIAGDQQNSVIVSGSADYIQNVKQILKQLDAPGQQIVFEVRVADIESNNDHDNTGIVFGGVDQAGAAVSGAGFTNFTTGNVSLNAQLNFLIQRGKGKILATPRIATLNNTAASLVIGTTYPVVFFDARTGNPELQTVRAGVNLSFTPTIAPDGVTTVLLSCEYSEVTGYQDNYPVIGTRQASDTLRVHDGEAIVLAGLFKDVDSETVTKVPIFGNIPILGDIFKNRQRDHTRDEIVFIITPHLVRDSHT